MSEFGKGSQILKLESVMKQVEAAVQHALRDIEGQMRGVIDFCCDYTDTERRPIESPLEAVFLAWFMCMARTYPGSLFSPSLNLLPQHTLQLGDKRFRLDFRVTVDREADSSLAEKTRVALPLIAVELDGHDFHERTKEQVAARNERDRLLTAAGWTVFHYSGSELYRDPSRCVEEVIRHAIDAYQNWNEAVFRAGRG